MRTTLFDPTSGLFSSMAYPTSGRDPICDDRKPWGVDIGMRGICRTVITVRRPGPCATILTV